MMTIDDDDVMMMILMCVLLFGIAVFSQDDMMFVLL